MARAASRFAIPGGAFPASWRRKSADRNAPHWYPNGKAQVIANEGHYLPAIQFNNEPLIARRIMLVLARQGEEVALVVLLVTTILPDPEQAVEVAPLFGDEAARHHSAEAPCLIGHPLIGRPFGRLGQRLGIHRKNR